MIHSIKKSSFGMFNFTAKFGKMKKEDSWSVYPVMGNILPVQCSNRWAEINLDTRIITLSSVKVCANSVSFMLDKINKKTTIDTLSSEDLDLLKQTIKNCENNFPF